ncbi:tetraspanin-9-like [Zophobas morio]|uniref:tetraspanin-9-like n=1 Tax=Zophobas morio TaxID=2755281 RepID=UPI003082F73B
MMKFITKKRRQSPPLDVDSFTSFFGPWTKNRAPPIYPNAQTGRTVDLSEFCLFFVAVMLLVIILGLTAMSVWSLLFKSHYNFLDCSTELAYFALPVAALCLPSAWMAFSVHNDKKSRRFLSWVLVLLILAMVVMAIGVYVGFSHKLNLKPSQIEGNPVLVEFRGSLRRSMTSYGAKSGRVWDDMQERLRCCGVDNYTDWMAVEKRIPESCCYYKEASCRDNSTFSTGCLKIITADLASQTCLFSGINCVALYMQSCAFVLVACIYFHGKRREGAAG